MPLITTERFKPSAPSVREQAEIDIAVIKRAANYELMDEILPIPKTGLPWWRRRLATPKAPLPPQLDAKEGQFEPVTAWLERRRRDPDGRIDFMLQPTRDGQPTVGPQAKLGLDRAGTLYDYGEEFTGFTPAQHGELMDSLQAVLLVVKHGALQHAAQAVPAAETATAHHFLGRVFSS